MYSRKIKLPDKKSFFLFGPRGVGKSTLVRERFPGAVYVDLLDSRRYQQLLADPASLQELVPPESGGVVIIDEVQRVPELLNEVHRLIESEGWQFVLTGSSARKLRRQGTNLLAGRAWTYYLYPLTARELGGEFELKQAVRYGMLPEVQNLAEEEAKVRYLHAYVETYLTEEVQQEGLTRNLAAFARFLQTVSFSVGSILNVTEVAREARVERKVVESYVGILEDLRLAKRVPVFARRSKRRLMARPKLYMFDTGVYQTLRPRGPLDTESEVGGVALENLFWQHLQAELSNRADKYEVSYWRTATGIEVDFVVYGPKGLWAFEVKSGGRLRNDWFMGLKKFGEDYPQAKRYLLYPGAEERYREGVTVMAVEKVLEQMNKVLGES